MRIITTTVSLLGILLFAAPLHADKAPKLTKCQIKCSNEMNQCHKECDDNKEGGHCYQDCNEVSDSCDEQCKKGGKKGK